MCLFVIGFCLRFLFNFFYLFWFVCLVFGGYDFELFYGKFYVFVGFCIDLFVYVVFGGGC